MMPKIITWRGKNIDEMSDAETRVAFRECVEASISLMEAAAITARIQREIWEIVRERNERSS